MCACVRACVRLVKRDQMTEAIFEKQLQNQHFSETHFSCSISVKIATLSSGAVTPGPPPPPPRQTKGEPRLHTARNQEIRQREVGRFLHAIKTGGEWDLKKGLEEMETGGRAVDSRGGSGVLCWGDDAGEVHVSTPGTGETVAGKLVPVPLVCVCVCVCVCVRVCVCVCGQYQKDFRVCPGVTHNP